jgi:antitoxin PrlF
MATATLTSKGQLTLPVAIRQALDVGPGDRIEFIQVAPGRFEIVAAVYGPEDIIGMVSKPDKPVSIEAMNEAIAQAGSKQN